MAIAERCVMDGETPEKQTAQVPPFEKFLAEREQVWKETSLPGDIFDQATGIIKRSNGRIETGLQHMSVATSTDVHNFAADEVEKELELNKPTLELAPRRPLAVVRQVAASLLTSTAR